MWSNQDSPTIAAYLPHRNSSTVSDGTNSANQTSHKPSACTRTCTACSITIKSIQSDVPQTFSLHSHMHSMQHNNKVHSIESLALGSSHSCALESSRYYIFCWGRNHENQIDVTKLNNTIKQLNNNYYNFKTIAAGYAHTCAMFEHNIELKSGLYGEGEEGLDKDLMIKRYLKNNTMVCWGRDYYGQLRVPKIRQSVDVEGGFSVSQKGKMVYDAEKGKREGKEIANRDYNYDEDDKISKLDFYKYIVDKKKKVVTEKERYQQQFYSQYKDIVQRDDAADDAFVKSLFITDEVEEDNSSSIGPISNNVHSNSDQKLNLKMINYNLKPEPKPKNKPLFANSVNSIPNLINESDNLVYDYSDHRIDRLNPLIKPDLISDTDPLPPPSLPPHPARKQPPSPALHRTITALSAGDEHTCIVVSDGLIRCWGSNDQGQCEVPQHLQNITLF
eukprot:Mrub_01297.p1 GENE.Mrub_01297~~Mrub_01297.p1  ORF type:complete len:446 (-),score=68.04 Mrub_01297:126-1463(-)